MLLGGISPTLAQSNEERPRRIWNVEIEGNTRYEDLVIKQYIANERPGFWKRLIHPHSSGMKVDELEIRKDVIRIERFYSRRGFANVEVHYRLEPEEKDPSRVHLYFEIFENTPIRIDSVVVQLEAPQAEREFIQQNKEYQNALNRIPFREGRIYQQIQEPETVGRITSALKNLGFVYANSSTSVQVDSTSGLAKVTITNTTGPRAKISDIDFVGQTTLDSRFIRRETGIKYGMYYSEDLVREAQREVFKHHLFRLALITIPDQPKDTTLELQLRVKELPLRSVRLRGGIGDFDRLDEPISGDNFWKLFRGQASWVYRNVRGKGEQFSTQIRGSYYDKRLGFEYLFPYVYNTKSSFSVSPYIQNRIEKTYSITSGGVINSFGYEYNRNLTGTFSYEFAVNNEYDIRNSDIGNQVQVLPDSILSYNVSSFSLNLYYARGLVRGERGLIIQPFIELSGLFNESTFSFQKAVLDVRKYTKLNKSLVLATRAQGGAIYYAKQDSLPSDIEFYTGGTSSVRGWGRDELGPKRPVVSTDTTTGATQDVRFVPFGGKTLFNFNVEFRQDLNRLIKGFGIAAFVDGGQVWSSLKNLDERPIQFGVGGGLRYSSPIGPVRVDFAYKVNPTDQDLSIYNGVDYGTKWSRWRIHFSIGQAF